ncbi:MAG TPA: IPT/TIG domain-containing protein, partial [Gemmatimonadaceae bacterium]
TGVSPGSGPIAGGTSVTITGTVFTGATAVTFDGVAATNITVVSATTITAKTPADSVGPADVAVTTAGGTGTLTGGYTYIGTLSITAAPANFSYSAALSGDPLTLSSSFAVSVNDATGSGAGWNLQATIGVLTDAASDTIPATDHTIQSVAVTGVTGTAPTNGISYPLAIPIASGKIFNAAVNTGTGQATTTFTTRLVVPADTAAGTYTATLTVTIAAGP